MFIKNYNENANVYIFFYIYIDLLNKENLTKEELDRLKISFAEGYLVARDQKGTKSQKWWKIFQSSIIVGLSIATLVSLFGNVTTLINILLYYIFYSCILYI